VPNYTNLTLEQMRSLTKNQLLDAIRTWLNIAYPLKRDLIKFLLDKDRDEKNDEVTYWPDGQIKRSRVTYRDLQTNDVLGYLVINWDYYDDGSINHITFSTRDAANVETEKYRIIHPLNGQPYLKWLFP